VAAAPVRPGRAWARTFVILTGGIDLFRGSVIAVSAMTAASIVVRYPNLNLAGTCSQESRSGY